MKTFSSFGAFAEQLAVLAVTERLAERIALTEAAKVIQKEAKRQIGEYQTDIQPFVDWAELADSTKADRASKGFEENEPLLRSGELRDSIEYEVGDNTAHIGSNNEIAVWQELGTDRIPPRSFLGGAAVKKAEHVRDIVGQSVVLALRGRQVHEGMIVLRKGDDD